MIQVFDLKAMKALICPHFLKKLYVMVELYTIR